jgi:hypothetical protein
LIVVVDEKTSADPDRNHTGKDKTGKPEANGRPAPAAVADEVIRRVYIFWFHLDGMLWIETASLLRRADWRTLRTG